MRTGDAGRGVTARILALPTAAPVQARWGVFMTIGHTFELMRMSWDVLMLDRELLLFPLMSGLALVLLGAATMAAGAAAGVAGWPSTEGDALRASDILGADGEVFRAGDVLQPSTTEGVALDTRGAGHGGRCGADGRQAWADGDRWRGAGRRLGARGVDGDRGERVVPRLDDRDLL